MRNLIPQAQLVIPGPRSGTRNPGVLPVGTTGFRVLPFGQPRNDGILGLIRMRNARSTPWRTCLERE